MFVFTAVSASGGAPASGAPSTAASASTSMGSPSTVPVPWASTHPTCAGSTWPSRRARRTTSCWASPLGALIAVDRPSWFDAVPRMTPTTGSLSVMASASRLSTTMPHPSAAHEPVGPPVERLAPTVGRHQTPLGEGHAGLRRQHHVDATGERQVAVAAAQAPTGEVHGDERRRARRVDGHARTAQVVEERQAVGDDAVHVPGQRVGIDVRRVAGVAIAVVVQRRRDEHAGLGAGEVVGGLAGPLQRLDSDLEDEALLRIHVCRLPRRDAEVGRVEPVDLVEEAAPARVHRAGDRGIRVEVGVGVPAVGRDGRDRVATALHELPERLGRVGTAGEAASHADDGDGLGAEQPVVVEPFAQLSGQQRQLHRRHRLGGSGHDPDPSSRAASASSSLSAMTPLTTSPSRSVPASVRRSA